jgi:hypothetical protein
MSPRFWPNLLFAIYTKEDEPPNLDSGLGLLLSNRGFIILAEPVPKYTGFGPGIG